MKTQGGQKKIEPSLAISIHINDVIKIWEERSCNLIGCQFLCFSLNCSPQTKFKCDLCLEATHAKRRGGPKSKHHYQQWTSQRQTSFILTAEKSFAGQDFSIISKKYRETATGEAIAILLWTCRILQSKSSFQVNYNKLVRRLGRCQVMLACLDKRFNGRTSMSFQNDVVSQCLTLAFLIIPVPLRQLRSPTKVVHWSNIAAAKV